jgi:GAF domain-containing protein
MTVQSEREAAFDDADVAMLQTMADQVALAIDNARLLRESTRALEDVRRTSGQLTAEAWSDLLRTRPDWGYRYVGGRVLAAEDDWAPEMTRALQTEQTVASVSSGEATDGTTMLSVPLRVRSQTVGALGFRRSGARGWTRREIEVLELLADQLGEALVGAQLYETAQDSAAREQLVGELATRMRQTLDVESVLRTAAQEVRQALDLPEVIVRLRSSPGRSVLAGDGE